MCREGGACRGDKDTNPTLALSLEKKGQAAPGLAGPVQPDAVRCISSSRADLQSPGPGGTYPDLLVLALGIMAHAAMSMTLHWAAGEWWLLLAAHAAGMAAVAQQPDLNARPFWKQHSSMQHRMLCGVGLAANLWLCSSSLSTLAWHVGAMGCVVAHYMARLPSPWLCCSMTSLWLAAVVMDAVVLEQGTCCASRAHAVLICPSVAAHLLLGAQSVAALAYDALAVLLLGLITVQGACLCPSTHQKRLHCSGAGPSSTDECPAEQQPASAASTPPPRLSCSGGQGETPSQHRISELHCRPRVTCTVSALDSWDSSSSEGPASSSPSPSTHSPTEAPLLRPWLQDMDANMAAAANAAAQPMLAYCSPLSRTLVAVKLSVPPGTGHLDLADVRDLVAATVQSAFAGDQLPGNGRSGGSGGGVDCSSHSWPMVSQSTAFKGCFQLVFELVRPAGAGSITSLDQSEYSQQLQQLVQQRLGDWLPPGWDVRAVQVGPLPFADSEAQQVQQGQEVGGGPEAEGTPGGLVAALQQPPQHSAPRAPSGTANSLADYLVAVWSQPPPAASGILLEQLALPSTTQATSVSGGSNTSLLRGSSAGLSPTAIAGTASAAAAATAAGDMRGGGSCGGSSASIRSANNSTATLWISKPIVQQLLLKGYRQVTAVVVAQPQAVALLHKSWDLLPLATPREGDSAAPAADLQLPLEFDHYDALQHAQGLGRNGQVKVLSVVVLAGSAGSEEPSRTTTPDASSAAENASEASSSTSSTTAAVKRRGAPLLDAATAAMGSGGDGGGDPSILVHLPLLLLPLACHREMQQLQKAATSAGMPLHMAIGHVLLPLVQDWVLVCLWGCAGDPSTSQQQQQPLQRMRHALYESLTAYFVREGMAECHKLMVGGSAEVPVSAALSVTGGGSGISLAGAGTGVCGSSRQVSSADDGGSTSAQTIEAGTMKYPQDFYLYYFKIAPCPALYPHSWSRCPFVHPNEKARRRDPRLHAYEPLMCPDDKKGVACPRGDGCSYTHNVYEFWLHPKKFRTQMCQQGAACKRPLCFFAHNLQELRAASAPADPNSPLEGMLAVMPPPAGPDSPTAQQQQQQRLQLQQRRQQQQHQHQHQQHQQQPLLLLDPSAAVPSMPMTAAASGKGLLQQAPRQLPMQQLDGHVAPLSLQSQTGVVVPATAQQAAYAPAVLSHTADLLQVQVQQQLQHQLSDLDLSRGGSFGGAYHTGSLSMYQAAAMAATAMEFQQQQQHGLLVQAGPTLQAGRQAADLDMAAAVAAGLWPGQGGCQADMQLGPPGVELSAATLAGNMGVGGRAMGVAPAYHVAAQLQQQQQQQLLQQLQQQQQQQSWMTRLP